MKIKLLGHTIRIIKNSRYTERYSSVGGDLVLGEQINLELEILGDIEDRLEYNDITVKDVKHIQYLMSIARDGAHKDMLMKTIIENRLESINGFVSNVNKYNSKYGRPHQNTPKMIGSTRAMISMLRAAVIDGEFIKMKYER